MNLAQTEDDLVNEIALMFADAKTVRCVPSDYAKAVIRKVREFRPATQFDRMCAEFELDALIVAAGR
jgi:hypothetical protein